MNGFDDATGGLRRGSDASLHTTIALIVALAATFTAVCHVKDGNIVHSMAQAQAYSVDAWTDYQARSTKQNIAEAAVEQITAQRDGTPNLTPEARSLFDNRIAEQTATVKQLD